jgi:hypothetical protein
VLEGTVDSLDALGADEGVGMLRVGIDFLEALGALRELANPRC